MALKLGDLSKVPPRQKVLITVLVCVLVVTGYYYLYYREASQRIDAMETQLAGLQSKIREQQAIAGNLRSFQDEVRRARGPVVGPARAASELGGDPLPAEERFRSREGIGARLSSFRPSGEIKKDFYAEIPVSISVNGDYHSFALFTDKVAHYPRS